jgi:hypothetical protein
MERLTLFKTSRKRNAITQESAKLNYGVTKEEKLGVGLIRWHDVETLGLYSAGCATKCERGGVGALIGRGCAKEQIAVF